MQTFVLAVVLLLHCRYTHYWECRRSLRVYRAPILSHQPDMCSIAFPTTNIPRTRYANIYAHDYASSITLHTICSSIYKRTHACYLRQHQLHSYYSTALLLHWMCVLLRRDRQKHTHLHVERMYLLRCVAKYKFISSVCWCIKYASKVVFRTHTYMASPDQRTVEHTSMRFCRLPIDEPTHDLNWINFTNELDGRGRKR